MRVPFPNSSRVPTGQPAPKAFLDRAATIYTPQDAFARTRAGWYGLFAGCCHAPPSKAVREAVTSGVLARDVSALMGPAAAAPWTELEADEGAIRRDFFALFKVAGPRYLRPNESVWTDTVDVEGNPRPKPLLMGPATVDAQKRWDRIGLAIERSSGELADFIGLELHFVEQLCVLEAEAWDRARPGMARFLLDQQRAFVEDHLDRWVRPLCATMEASAQSQFYKGLARVLPSFLDLDRATMRALLAAA